MKISNYGYVLLLGALLVTAIIPIAYQLGNGINPVLLLLLVSFIGTLVSITIVLIKGTAKHIKDYFTKKEGILSVLSFGLLAYVFISLIFAYVTHYVSADLLAVIYRTWPLMLILIAPYFMRERMTKYDMLGVVIGFGSLTFVLINSAIFNIPYKDLIFVFLLLISAFFDAISAAVSKRYQFELTSSIFVYNLISLAIFLPLCLFMGVLNFSNFSSQTLLSVFILGIFQNVILTFLFVASFRSVKTSIASSALLISPFITMILSFLLIKTPIQLSYLVIAAGVVIGILIQRLQPKRSNYIAKFDNGTSNNTFLFDVTSAFVNTKSERVYHAIKGKGRALAFYLEPNKVKTDPKESIINRNSDGYIIFTNRNLHDEVIKEEIDLIKNVIGAQENDLVIVGIGDPEIIEPKLIDASKKLSL